MAPEMAAVERTGGYDLKVCDISFSDPFSDEPNAVKKNTGTSSRGKSR